MQFNKTVSNPYLAGAIALMREDNTIKHKQIFIEQLLKGSYYCPVLLSSEPKKDEQGSLELVPETGMQILTLKTPEGKQYFMAFTCKEELHKWKKEEDCPYTLTCSFLDYVALLLHKHGEAAAQLADGFVIDPFGSNMVVDKDMVANIMIRKEI